ncbi:MAG: ECF-type sigma factor [Pirellulales bacterium]
MSSIDVDSALANFRAETYSDLKRMASIRLRSNPLRSQISCTSLVHESIVKFRNRADLNLLTERKQFFATMAYIMRSVLVDLARRKQKEARHLIFASIGLSIDESSQFDEEDFLQLNIALSKLSEFAPDIGRVVHLRIFVGIEFAEIARQLDVSLRTAKRWWAYGKAWLKLELENAA